MRSLVLIALLTTATPIMAQEQAKASKRDTAALEKKICRNMAPTGSRLQKRECHTKAEWAAINGQNADENLLARSQRQNGRF